MKKFLSILIIAFIIMWPIYMMLTIDSPSDDREKAKEIKEWKGVITLWDYPRLNTETSSRYGWIKDKIRKFEKENPGVYIDLKPIDWNTGPVKLEVGLTTGNLPDIAPIGADFTYMNGNILEPLNDYFTREELNGFRSQAIQSVSYGGKIWGVPFMMTTYGMYLNLDLFRSRGVEPPIDGNWTYDEFIEKMQKLTWDSDNDGEIDQYGFVSFVEPNYYNIWGIILSDGAEIIDKETESYVFYGEKAIKGLYKVIDLKNKYKVTPEDFGLIDEKTAWTMFYQDKKVAVYPTGTWAVNVLNKSYFNGTGFDFAVANYPIGDRRIPISFNNCVSAYGIFKQNDEKKLKMCVKFLKFIVQDEFQKELEQLGVFPAKKGIKDIYINNTKMKKLEDCLYYTKPIPRHPKWKDIDRILQNQIRLAIIGEKSPEEALNEAKTQINQLFSFE